jgi:hypothetical protein
MLAWATSALNSTLTRAVESQAGCAFPAFAAGAALDSPASCYAQGSCSCRGLVCVLASQTGGAAGGLRSGPVSARGGGLAGCVEGCLASAVP